MAPKQHTSRRQAPSHLTAEGRALWSRLFRTYRFDLEASRLLLTSLVDSWEHERRCRDALKGLPLTVTDKHGGTKIHPLLVESRQARDHGDQDAWWDVFLLTQPDAADLLHAAWQTHRDGMLRDWCARQPGTRPWAWWQFDAPEPLRRRLSGIGDTLSDDHAFGVPTDWCLPVHQFTNHVAVDPRNPPTYESEATYLERHGLLSADERARVPERGRWPLALLPKEEDT